jgi:arogenate/prephenate dehydratase
MVVFQTSIVFSLEEGPGQLFKALAVFALREINLTKVCPTTLSCHMYTFCRNDALYMLSFLMDEQIESRPHKERPLRVSDDCLLKLDAKPVAF